MLNEHQVLHLGISGAYQVPRGDNEVQFQARPEAHSDDTHLVSTGQIQSVDYYTFVGLEFAWNRGPLSLQTEYLRTDIERETASSLAFDGWYVSASWFLTGEMRNYVKKYGEFGRITLKRPLHKGGIGAWELGLRFSQLDLNDADIQGGKEDNITLGLNWYPNSHLRFMLNYINVSVENAVTSGRDEDIDIYQTRMQIEF